MALEVEYTDLRQYMPAYKLAGQYLVSQLEQEVNSKRTLHIQGMHISWEAVIALFRIQFIKYIRQLPPFDQHNNNETPMEYWNRLLDREDASILAYLAIKLFSILPNSMPDERTGSAFTKINSSDRSNQNANMVVAMAQVLQHEHRKATSQRNPTLIRFRDIPGLIKSTNRLPAAPLEHMDYESNDNESAAADSESDDEPPQYHNNDVENIAILDEPREWEINAGLDEEPEPVLGTSADTSCCEYFEVAKRDGIDLNIPLLWDLLSDTPDEEDSIHGSTLTKGENRHQLPYVDIYASPTEF